MSYLINFTWLVCSCDEFLQLSSEVPCREGREYLILMLVPWMLGMGECIRGLSARPLCILGATPCCLVCTTSGRTPFFVVAQIRVNAIILHLISFMAPPGPPRFPSLADCYYYFLISVCRFTFGRSIMMT